MTPFCLVIFAVAISIASAYDFTFTVELKGPSQTECSSNDLKKVFRRLESALQQKGNQYLQFYGLPAGSITEIIIRDSNRRQLDIMAVDEVTSYESMIQDEQADLEDRRLQVGFTWSVKGDGKCRGCPFENKDSRRVLRRGDSELRTSRVSNFVNDEMVFASSSYFRTNGLSKSCQASAESWTVTFNWD